MERVILHGGDGTTGMPLSTRLPPPTTPAVTWSYILTRMSVTGINGGGGDRVPAVLGKRLMGFGCVGLCGTAGLGLLLLLGYI